MEQKQFHKTPSNCAINFISQFRSKFSILRMDLLLLFLLVAFVFIIYSSSIKGPFVFDDVINIRDNPHIRLTQLTHNGIVRAGFKSPCQRRPLANISFALNYYFNRYDVTGYHVVNILMHMITGIILFYFIKITLGLLNANNLKPQPVNNKPQDKRNFSIDNSTKSSISTLRRSLDTTSKENLFIAFFTTCIWLVHPLQTQTVSYIVQRMNCMAAMFYILSLLLYVKARLEISKGKKQALFFGCIFFGILSLGSKEIAVTLPFFIFLYEWYFLQNVNLRWLKRNSIYLLGVLFLIVFIVMCFLDSHPLKTILSTFNDRDFTLCQRVLTEFRVVIFYLGLIIFPHPDRLNLLHDFSISHSFLDPITTLVSFVAIAGMIVAAIWLAKRNRLLSFSILWFLGNLAIESSVVGAEIIFEHRLYLPSMFLMLLFVSSVYRFPKSKWIGGILLCFVAATFSGWTYQRNVVWNDEVTFWEDCVKKSPNKPRQHYNLGVVLARKGNLDEAIHHYFTALNFKPDYLEAYYNLGNALARKGDENAALYNYRKVLQLNPDYLKARYNMARILSNQGKTGEALHHYQKALIINNEIPQTLYNLSWIYATSENRRYRNGEKAIKLAEKLCKLTNYQQPLALDALAAASAEIGKFDQAVVTAKKALDLAMKLGPEEHVRGLTKRIKLYQAGQPFRQSLKQKNEP